MLSCRMGGVQRNPSFFNIDIQCLSTPNVINAVRNPGIRIAKCDPGNQMMGCAALHPSYDSPGPAHPLPAASPIIWFSIGMLVIYPPQRIQRGPKSRCSDCQMRPGESNDGLRCAPPILRLPGAGTPLARRCCPVGWVQRSVTHHTTTFFVRYI